MRSGGGSREARKGRSVRSVAGPPLTRREFLAGVGLAGAGVSSGAAAPRSECERSRPNILFLLTDDQRWDTLGCAGHPLLKTPHIDRLAASGVLFTNTFVTTSICPSNRACILSGQHMRTHGVRGFQESLPPGAFRETYPALLRDAGYRTGFIGKYGIGDTETGLWYPASQFDYWRGFEGQGNYFQELGEKQVHSTRLITRQAVEFLRGCSKDRPWCLSISFKAPHHPWSEYDPEFASLFEGEAMPLAASATDAAEKAQPEFIRESLAGSRSWGWSHSRLQEWIRYYYRLVAGVDVAVGRIMAELAERGMAAQTVVFYTSDNGYMLYEHGLLGKWLMYEESIRVPMIVLDPRLPRERRGHRCDEMVLSIDCAPTMLAMAGLSPPESMQGLDLSLLLGGQRVDWREDWFYEHTFTEPPPRYIPSSQGVRTAGWKYVRYVDQDPHFEQLFDLASDRLEMTNLAGEPGCAEMLDRLRRRLRDWLGSLPSAKPNPDGSARRGSRVPSETTGASPAGTGR